MTIYIPKFGLNYDERALSIVQNHGRIELPRPSTSCTGNKKEDSFKNSCRNLYLFTGKKIGPALKHFYFENFYFESTSISNGAKSVTRLPRNTSRFSDRLTFAPLLCPNEGVKKCVIGHRCCLGHVSRVYITHSMIEKIPLAVWTRVLKTVITHAVLSDGRLGRHP